MLILHWNGAEMPAELTALPPGRYVLEPVDAVPQLSEDEENGLARALASLDRGEGMDEDELDARVGSILRP